MSRVIKIQNKLNSNYIIVRSVKDLHDPINGIIYLTSNTTYLFSASIDLNGKRLVCGENTTIIGGSSENSRIKSTGLTGTALITSTWSLPIRNITLEADVALNLDATANENQALDWFGVNFTNCNTIGTIKYYNNFIATDCAFLNSGSLTFDGTIGTIGFSSCLFDINSSNTGITLPSTLTISRRFRIIYSAFVVLSGETGINVSTSANIPVEGYILDTVNFSGGGTYRTGVIETDNKALFIACRGINNSAEISYYTMNGNAIPTIVASTGVEYKVLGTTTSQSITQKFTNTNNRATYNGALTRSFEVSVTASCTSGNNNQVGFYIAKNGVVSAPTEMYITTGGTGRAEGAKVQGVFDLSTNDYIEVFTENNSAVNNIVVTDLSVIIKAIN